MKTAKVGDIYTFWSEEIQKWILIQVVSDREKDQIAILDIDAYFDVIPNPEDLKNLQPLIINHHNWNKHNARFIGTNKVPDRIKYITNIDPIIDIDVRSYSFGWPKNFLQCNLQRKWDLLDKKLTSAYKKADRSMINIGGREISLDSSKICYNEEENIDISEYSKLPALTQIICTSKSDHLIPFISSNPLIQKLEWENHKQKTIDLSNTNISDLKIDVSTLNKLKLSKEMRSLSFLGDLNNLHNLNIETPLDGRLLEITINTNSDLEIPSFGLKNLSELAMTSPKIDFKKLSKIHPNLNSLRIWGYPGYIDNFKSLSNFNELQTLQLNDLFGFGKEDVPTKEKLPHLEFLWLTSIPSEAGKEIKKEFKHVATLRITKLRNDKWLAENLNNPFRDWDGRDGISNANAKKAANAFKKLNTAVDKKLNEKDLTDAFLEFLHVFNAIDEKQGIETIEREEIYSIYMALAKKCTINEDVLFELFEKNREF